MTLTLTETAPAASPFLTEAQAAARLAISPKTLRNWRSRAEGPTWLKLGAVVRYHQDVLDTWALAQSTRNRAA